MKRHPSLTPLSREHHSALILARLLQKSTPPYKGLPADTEGKAEYAFNFYQHDLVKHFEEEEKVMRILKGKNPSLDLLMKMIFAEHQELHGLFQSINDHPDLISHLDTLGKTLETHVRKEERQLFPLIEQTCSEEIMAAIHKALSQS